jgi:hypothetical protein
MQALPAALVVCLGVLGCGGQARDSATHSARTGTGPVHEAADATGPLRGSIASADSLANTRIGGPYGTVLAYRFRAAWTGVVRGVRVYVVVNSDGRSGYSAGTGGTLRVALARDAGRSRHQPGAALAATTLSAPPRDTWPLVPFSKPPRVVAGHFYYVVFTNVDRDPESNYVSINALVSYGNRGTAPRLPDGMAVLLGDTADGSGTPSAWTSRSQHPGDRYAPILEVVGARGSQHFGLGYMEVWTNNPKPIGAGAGVRQLLGRRPAGTITGAWLRVQRRSGATAPLSLRIERTDGHVLAARSVPASAVRTSGPQWVHVRFRRAVEVSGKEGLALVAAASGSESYDAFPIRKGTEFGFDADTVFQGGYAQFRSGSGWLGWDQWGGHDLHSGDLQFALDTR